MTRILLAVALVAATGGCAVVDAIDRAFPASCEEVAAAHGDPGHFDHDPPRCSSVEYRHCGGWDPICEECGPNASGCIKQPHGDGGLCIVFYVDERTKQHERYHIEGCEG